MTVTTTTSRFSYAGNGVTTVFSFPAYFLANADLVVYKKGVLQTITTHYTVSGAGNPAGGSVTFLVAPLTGDDIVIFRNPAATQGVDLVTNDALPAETVEQALDRAMMVIQRALDLVNRSFRLPDSDTSNIDLTVGSLQAGRYVRANSTATALEFAALTSSGTLGVPVSVLDGGTGGTTAAAARTNLGVVNFSAASPTEVLTGTDTTKGVTPDALAALWEQGADVASAATISLGEGGYFNITGTTTITDIDFATDKAGRTAWLKFAGALTITHNATTLILPGGANIVTAAGDTFCFVSEGSDVVRCVAQGRGVNRIVQIVSTQTGAVATGTTVMPYDDTIPQNTEGDEYMAVSITPKSTTNKLRIDVVLFGALNIAPGAVQAALFQDSAVNSLAAGTTHYGASGHGLQLSFSHIMDAGTTGATTFKVRAGPSSGATMTFNGSGGARLLGGVMASSIRITEFVP